MAKGKLIRKRGVTGKSKLPCFKWYRAGSSTPISVELTEGGQNVLAHINMQALRERGEAK